MNSIITLGIVLNVNDETLTQMEPIMDLIETYVTSMEITYPKDGDYNDWKTEFFKGNIYDTINYLAYRTSYADLVFNLNGSSQEVRFSITNEGEEILLKFEINEETLIPSKDTTTLELVTNRIASIFDVIERNAQFKYLFCDKEAEYITTLERLIELEHQPYAMFKMHDRVTVLAPWFLDGFTLREQ